MTSFCDEWRELCAYTQLYLQQNYPLHTRFETSPEHFAYFKGLATVRLPPPSSASVPVEEAPMRPPPSMPMREKAAIAPAVQTSPPAAVAPAPAPLKAPERKKERLPALQPIVKENKTFTPKGFALTTLPDLPDSGDELPRLLRESAPHLTVVAAPLPPRLTAPIGLLLGGETAAEQAFVASIAQAITLCLGVPCQLIEAELWLLQRAYSSPPTQLLLASASRLSALPALLTLQREDAKQGTAFLADIPLLPLPDLSLSMRQPALKAALWNTICQAVRRHVR